MPRKEKVVRIIDGDTIMTASRKNPVRLADVNAPERGQKGSRVASDALSKLVSGKEVTINTISRDRYGRSVAEVRIGRQSVNKAMKDVIKRQTRSRTAKRKKS